MKDSPTLSMLDQSVLRTPKLTGAENMLGISERRIERMGDSPDDSRTSERPDHSMISLADETLMIRRETTGDGNIPERPESPSGRNGEEIFELNSGDGKTIPPTIAEEEEPIIKENTPLRNFRRLVAEQATASAPENISLTTKSEINSRRSNSTEELYVK